jgi:hypothetical protein
MAWPLLIANPTAGAILKNEDLVCERHGKSSTNYPVFTWFGQAFKVNIDDLDTNDKEMTKLLKIYRGRYTGDRSQH